MAKWNEMKRHVAAGIIPSGGSGGILRRRPRRRLDGYLQARHHLSFSLNYNHVPFIHKCVHHLAFLCFVSSVLQQLSNSGSVPPEV